MDFVEDFAGAFGDFGVEVTLAGRPVSVIFDDGYAESFGGMVAGSGPRAVIASDLAPPRGVSLLHGGQEYKVVGIEPDGTGLALLRLEAQ